MAILCSSITWALPGFVTGVKSSFLLFSSLIGLVIPVTHLYGLTSWVLKSERNNMTTEHENGKESVLYWIFFSVFANLELLLLIHWRPISHISYTFNCLDLSLRGNSLPLDLSLIILKPSCPIP